MYDILEKAKTIGTKIRSGAGCGRRELTLKEYLETFWIVGNILYPICGSKYMTIYFSKLKELHT